MTARQEHPAQLQVMLAGTYEIEGEVGAGGMATVYRARDLKHDRRVALKVLKPELAAVVGAERFLSEIRTTANLQHPHILALFDSGNVGGSVYYAMPFVQGESLRDRLEREKQLPLDDALRITREVADALQYAHSHGVIHRDIKPENIMLQDGHALVADFGIALAASSAGGQRMTETGMSLGTPAYMSPEQAMGERAIDARTDVYALGCVLYEMLAGEPPFTGPTAQAIVARVLTEEPRSLCAQRRSVPPEVDAAVATALAKLPADRFASAAAFAAALQRDGRSWTALPARGSTAATGQRRLALALGSAVVLAGALAAWGWLRPAPEAPLTRTFVAFPDGERPILRQPAYALFPDGSAMVYVGPGPGGSQLWIKRRAELRATPIGGTAGANGVFISPDGQWIGFTADDRVMRMPAAGGTPVRIGAGNNEDRRQIFPGGAFLPDGRVVFTTGNTLLIASPNDAAADSLVTSAAVGGFSALYPSPLPDSRGVVFTACTSYCNRADLWVVDVATRKARRLRPFAARPVYVATGHLLFQDQEGSVYAQPFDLKTMTLSGNATRVLENVIGGAAVATNGTLLYGQGDGRPRSELVTVAPDGREQPIDTTWRGNFVTVVLSPDGSRIATSLAGLDGEHLWIKTLGGGAATRLTFDRAQHTIPVWTHDGSGILHTRFSGDSSTFLLRRADGTGGVQVLRRGDDWVIESAVSRDGAWLVQREYRRDGSRNIYARRWQGDTTLRPLLTSSASHFSPTLSPDGRWLAFSSNETGANQVWVVPFPEPGAARWQVSHDGGIEPVWSRDGRALYYVNGAGALVRASVSATGASFGVGESRTLFQVERYRRHPTHRAYDVLPGDRGFVMIRDGSPSAEQLVLVDNWFTELRRIAR